MNGPIPLSPLYAFMTWAGTTKLYLSPFTLNGHYTGRLLTRSLQAVEPAEMFFTEQTMTLPALQCKVPRYSALYFISDNKLLISS